MKRSHGLRVGTRSILRRRRSERSRINISRVMHDYAEGDRVAIVLDGGQQRGMPHRRFQGRTGFIQRRQGAADRCRQGRQHAEDRHRAPRAPAPA